MTKRRCLVLLAAAAWTAYVWITRLFLMWPGDESIAFKLVHTALAVISLGFAGIIAWYGVDGLRSLRARQPMVEGAATE